MSNVKPAAGAEKPPQRLIRVLVVDDSAYVRKIMTQMLTRSPFIEVVGTARNGLEALDQVEALDPDVVTLDLLMPELDGIGFLRAQMARRAVPVVVCSIASEDGQMALEALDAGAVDFVQKPTALATDKVFEIATEIIDKVKAAAGANISRMARPSATALPPLALLSGSDQRQADIIVIGISTGGPQGLRYLIPQLPADFPVPVAIVLHMPVGYTEAYAQRLDADSQIEVREAREGDEVRAGLALLAPAGHHLSFVRQPDGRVLVHLDLRPFDTPHRPAVDVMFRSAAEVFGSRSLGIVMTGMGCDGQAGAAAIKARAGRIFTEAEESCVVYGMPRAVAEAGLSDRSEPLTRMARAILEAI